MAAVPLDALQDVRVVGDHHVGAGVDRGLRDPAQERALDLGELEAAVELGDDDVGARVAQPLDLGGHGTRRVGRGAAVATPRDPVLQLGIRRRGRDRRPQLGLPVVGERRRQALELGPRVAGPARRRRQVAVLALRTVRDDPRLVLPRLRRRQVGRDRVVGGRELVVDEVTVDRRHRHDTDRQSPAASTSTPRCDSSVVSADPTDGIPASSSACERRHHPCVLPVEGVVVAERDEVDAELVEHVGDDRRRLEEEALARIGELGGELADDGLEVDDRRIRGRRHRTEIVDDAPAPTPSHRTTGVPGRVGSW